MKKLLTQLAVVAVLATSVTGIAGTTVHARGEGLRKGGIGYWGTGCKGRPLKYGPQNLSQGRQLAALYIYYSPDNAGTYCAFVRNFVHNGSRHFMEVKVEHLTRRRDWASDSKDYKYYAGTVSVPYVGAGCVKITGTYERFRFLTVISCGSPVVR